ncbi:MAG: aminodeoxychorismate/anthranilate synthase component II [Planctomycetes bacterium]|nr:aminodeoxychorismate/anthranilate synthase component II [Planctomycetota bacterium]
MVLVIDNYDSFTYNLVRLIRQAQPGTALTIRRNDDITIEDIGAIDPSYIVISPGPGRPDDAGASLNIIARFGESLPILGVCLGHQCIAQAFGGRVVPARSLVHGKTSRVHHSGCELFADLPTPFTAARYHSLGVDRETLPDDFLVSAWTADSEIMGIRHRYLPLYGIQFHPESFLTPGGQRIMSNFLHSSRHSMQVR